MTNYFQGKKFMSYLLEGIKGRDGEVALHGALSLLHPLLHPLLHTHRNLLEGIKGRDGEVALHGELLLARGLGLLRCRRILDLGRLQCSIYVVYINIL